ncbi:MAG: hypothetical protein J6W73_08040, partial [Verrucomicrobia bacterium]|nr:hypothetical protein [Verrucomicrobiota bacterium]
MSKKQNLKLYGVCLAAAGSLFLANQIQAAVGDIFTASTVEDILLKYTVLTEEGSTGTVSVETIGKYIGPT